MHTFSLPHVKYTTKHSLYLKKFKATTQKASDAAASCTMSPRFVLGAATVILALVLFIGIRQSPTYIQLQSFITIPSPQSPPSTSFLSSPAPRSFHDNASFLQDHHVRQSPLVAKGRLFHVHHACVHGGHNGLVVPHLGGVLAAMAQDEDENAFFRPDYYPDSTSPVAFRMFTFEEAIGLFGTSHLQYRYQAPAIPTKRMVAGPTFFLNCWQRTPDDTNPSHWLMKVVTLFEISQMVLQGSLWLPTFRHLVFHQCPSYHQTIQGDGVWPWGQAIWKAATSVWWLAGLWPQGFDDDGVDPAAMLELDMGSDEWTCFEDLYLEPNYGSWFPAPEFQAAWRNALLTQTASGREAKNIDSLQDRCRTNTLKIHVFQRSSGRGRRAFANLDEVLALARRYTASEVPVVTVDAATPVDDQARVFQAFDVLISSHGSQLANIIFSDPAHTAIVEVLPVVRDTSFHTNAQDAGMAAYIVSTGHAPVAENAMSPPSPHCTQGQELMETHCWSMEDGKSGHAVWDCPRDWRSKLTGCDTRINITLLETHLKKAITDLCKEIR